MSYGWIVGAAGAALTCVAVDALFSRAVYPQPIASDTGWPATGSPPPCRGLIVIGQTGFVAGSRPTEPA